MNIRELYEKGQAWFRFSDGETRRVIGKGASGSLLFEVTRRGGTEQHHIYYYENGRPNLGGTFPTVVGVAEDESMSEQGERSKRDEVQRAIEDGVSNSIATLDDDEEYNDIVARVLAELDSLVERWTDEETAEDLDKSIGKSEVYEGMRVRMINPDDSNVPVGHTGTIVHPDEDGIPAVMWDSADYNTSLRSHNHGDYCNHVTVEELEKE